jgi:hypothetical protein
LNVSVVGNPELLTSHGGLLAASVTQSTFLNGLSFDDFRLAEQRERIAEIIRANHQSDIEPLKVRAFNDNGLNLFRFDMALVDEVIENLDCR